jgi:transcriptional regulator with XRE-family HTH domain
VSDSPRLGTGSGAAGRSGTLGAYVSRVRSADERQGRPSEALAANIRGYRALGGITQVDLAARMTHLGHGWGRSTVSAIEARNRNVTADELFGLALNFGVTIGQLFDPTGPDHGRKLSLDVGLVVDEGSTPLSIDPDVAQLWGASRLIVRLWHDSGRVYALDVADDPSMTARLGSIVSSRGSNIRTDVCEHE